MKKVCAAGEVIKGMDISGWQPKVDWSEVIKAGVQFCFIKASEGVNVTDHSFAKHWAEAKANGIIRGAYHFFHPGQDPKIQAQLFCMTVGKLASGDMPMVLDWESTDNKPSVPDVMAAQSFLEEVEKLSGIKPMLYTGPYFFDALGVSLSDFNQYPLWIAHYGTACPLVPLPWVNWTFWQTSESMNLPGTGRVDSDLFNGSLDQLKKLTLV